MFNQVLTIAGRVMMQLFRDRRTMVLLILVPLVIASIVGVSMPERQMLDYIAPAVLAVLILFFGFILTGISFLRERSQGTLERLMASPVSKGDVVGGYLLGFLLFAVLQTMILFFYFIYVLDVSFAGALWQIIVFQIIIGILSVCLGIFISVFARNEFQMVQFIPIIIVPQIFLCGLLWPVGQMPDYLQWIAKFLPLTYGVDGIRALMLQGQGLLDIGKEIGVLAGYAAGLMVLASLTLRRGAAS
ncbi:MAG: ABC transporter permease [Dehalococcoidia bacterium]|jgi:ABC-2 type transport system permease protein